MTPVGFVEGIAALAMVGGMFAILWTRTDRGIGIRAIQFCAVVFTLPTILILALEKAIPTDVTGTLLGAIAGYLLSGISGAPKTEEQSSRADVETPERGLGELLRRVLSDLEVRLLRKVHSGLGLIGPKTPEVFEGADLGRIMKAADRLKQLGLVELKDPDDMQRVGIILTKRGRESAAALSRSAKGPKRTNPSRSKKRKM